MVDAGSWLLPDGDEVARMCGAFGSAGPRDYDEAAARLIRRTAWRSGLLGAVTSVGGFTTLLVALPIDLVVSARMEARLACLLGALAGRDAHDPELRICASEILAGRSPDAAVRPGGTHGVGEALRSDLGQELRLEAGEQLVSAGAAATAGSARRIGTRGFPRLVARALPRLVAKLVPGLGAVIGFAVNWKSVQDVGRLSAEWFRSP